MKKSIVFLFVFLFLIFPLTETFAGSDNQAYQVKDSYIEFFADGSYAVIEIIYPDCPDGTTGTTSGQKKYTYYNDNNVKQRVICLDGTFTYTGSSATCNSASTSYSISNNSWSVTKAQASRSGATATGEFTVKKYSLGIVVQTVNKTLTLTCSPTGVLS